LHNEQEVIGDVFLTELLDVLEDMHLKAKTDAEHKLMYELLKALNDTIEFTND